MTIGKIHWEELKIEAEVTRKFLKLVPFEKATFKPAPKSEQLGNLAIHIAEILGWWEACVMYDKLDFYGFEPEKVNNNEQLMLYFESLLRSAKKALLSVEDSVLDKLWSMTYGSEVLFTLPKKQVLRVFCMNHLIHHRAQLGVYLRMLDIPIPATYGPSADDEEVITIRSFNYG